MKLSEPVGDEDDHHREVYARFGLAAYHAQVLEAGMANVLTVAEVFPDPAGTRERFDAALERHFRRNFGQLRARLARHLAGDQDLVEDLAGALLRRNFLTHRFWYERVHLMVTVAGRNDLIDELNGYVKEFSGLDRRVEAVLLRHAASRGVTHDDIVALAERQRRQWTAADANDAP